jgi:hypothetical protein
MVNRSSEDQIVNRARLRRGGFVSKLWNTRGAIALLLLPVLLATYTKPQATSAQEGTTIEEVEEETNQYIGKTVTVSGEIKRQVSPKAFIIQDNDFLGGEDVLVVSATEAPIIEDTLARVTGTVRELTIAEVEREYGFDLEPELEVELRDKPMIVATATALTPRLNTIADKPAPFLGRIVTVTGEVERVIGPNSFTLDEEDLLKEEDLLVVSATPPGDIEEGSRVQVTGIVGRFTSTELEREFNLGPAREYEVYVQNRPGIVAQRTRVVEE